MSQDQSAPAVSVHLTLDPQTYSFSNPKPPHITVTATSHANQPITLFTYGRYLFPKGALYHQGFVVTDLATDERVPQATVTLQQKPFTRCRGHFDAEFFLTLHPEEPLELTAEFARGGKSKRPHSKDDVEADQDSGQQEGSVPATGVDGLEPGHRYKIRMDVQSLEQCWWRYGVKEDMLVDEGSEKPNLADLPSEQEPLRFEASDEVELAIKE